MGQVHKHPHSVLEHCVASYNFPVHVVANEIHLAGVEAQKQQYDF